MRGVVFGVLENPPLTSRGLIFFVQTPNWLILDSLKRLRGVEPIHIMLDAMEGHDTTLKFIFLTLIMLSLV